ncbi:hypothetical protein HMN09_01025700 [Mycena chlorophos]|uniref:Mid2 domain-containing protein n=1 Tax=Mycena chlorophos TaxID=658473 RepID=A0A8H6W3L5_MYCCL|nr:hypothetical protein HMN09_01025700 [Mycena chlorophos]
MLWTLVISSPLATSFAAPSNPRSSSSGVAICLLTDMEGSLLDSSNVTSNGQVACAWQIACDCLYDSPSGALASGSSSCPKSITPGHGSSSSSSSSSSSGSSSSAKLNQDFEDTAAPHDDRLSPAVIAGLVINGVFVLGLLALVAVCIFKRPRVKPRSTTATGMKVLYTSVDNHNGHETFVPLTHGTTEGRYYDPHEDNKDGTRLADGNSRFEDD